MTLCRLIYKSIASAEIVSNETLLDIETRARKNNAANNITGLLVHSGRHFLQVLEGMATDVTELFGRIWSDNRHGQVELITFESASSRLFNQWDMRLVDLHDLPGEQRAMIAQKYAGQHDEITLPSDLHQIYAFLFDAQHICLSTPWRQEGLHRAKDREDQAC